jgi:predicted ATPase
VLATSQEPLRVPGEQQFRVPPLAVPADAGGEHPEAYGAVALFAARARAADPRFALDAQNLATVIEICRRLDGLPLAIELAAARVPLLGAAGVRERLDSRFRMLTAATRGGLQRHQTLRATIEWSYGLLDAAEQAVLRRLGVCAGSFGLETAQRVAADAGIDEWAVLDHLGVLVDKSLVMAQTQSAPRYRLLETERAWALEKLAEAGELEATRRRHALAMLQVFDGSYAQRWTVPANVRLDRYLPDLDNLRAALDWAAQAPGEADLHVALTGAGAWIWFRMARGVEGLRRCESAIARIGPATPPALEARLLGAWSQMAWPRIGAAERSAGARAVQLLRGGGDREALYVALFDHGANLARSGELAEAERAFVEAAALHRPGWPPALRWVHLVGYINLRWRQGRYAEMSALCEEELRLSEQLGNTFWALHSLMSLEQAASSLGRHDEAVARGRELLARVRRERFVGDLAGHVLANLTRALTEAGHLDEALLVGRDALQELLRLEMNLGMFLDEFALLALRRGHAAAAARALGRAETVHAAGDSRRQPNQQRLRDTLIGGLQEALPAAELQRWLAEGARLPDEDAARGALRD